MRVAMIQDDRDSPALIEFLDGEANVQYNIELTVEEAIYLTAQLQQYLFSVKTKIEDTLSAVANHALV